MKTLGIILVILTSSFAQAFEYTCTTSIWSKGIFGTYFISSLPRSVEMDTKNQLKGEVRGLEIGSANLGKLRFVVNGVMDCSQRSCFFEGTLTEILKDVGFLGQYYVSVGENEEKVIGIHEDRVFKISCEKD